MFSVSLPVGQPWLQLFKWDKWISYCTPINKYQNEGYPIAPKPSCTLLPIPHGTPRDLETKLLNLFYKNNITNSFHYTIGKAQTPLCPTCKAAEDSISHIILSCNNTSDIDKNKIKTFLSSDYVDEIATLNMSRNPEFIKTMIDITRSHNFPSEINLNIQYI